MNLPKKGNESFAVFPPSPDLRPFLHRILHGWGQTVAPSRVPIPPTGGVFFSYVSGAPLRVHFSDRIYDERPRYFIGGQLRREQPVLESLGRFGLFGAELAPTGFYRLFHTRADRFTDDIADFAALYPRHAARLDMRLSPEAPADETAANLQDFLCILAKEALATPRMDAIVHHISAEGGLISVGDLCRRHKMSERQLHREFLKIVGIPPKHYAKIVQINSVIGALQTGGGEQIAHLAMEHGYFDQSHFIRDFRRFVSANPGDFLRSESDFLRTFLGEASH